MGPMRDYLQFQQPPDQSGFGGGQDDELGKLIAQMQSMQPQRVPMLPEVRRAPLPDRPQASFWDLIPQLLAGAGDTVNAGAGMRSNALGQVQGQQRGMRDQAWGDQVNQQNVGFENRRADRADEMMRYQMQNAAQQQQFAHGSKLAELLMMHQALTEQQQKKNAMRQIFEQGLPMDLGEASSAQDLDKAAIKKLQESGGDPQMMDMVRQAKQLQLQRIAQQQQPGPMQKGLKSTSDWFLNLWAKPDQQEQNWVPVPNPPRQQSSLPWWMDPNSFMPSGPR